MHLVGILFPCINEDARSKSHQIPVITLRTSSYRIQNFLLLLTDSTCVFYVDPRKEKSDYVPTLIGFYDRQGMFLTARYALSSLNVSEEILVL